VGVCSVDLPDDFYVVVFGGNDLAPIRTYVAWGGLIVPPTAAGSSAFPANVRLAGPSESGVASPEIQPRRPACFISEPLQSTRSTDRHFPPTGSAVYRVRSW
jgi:hypothetical protein